MATPLGRVLVVDDSEVIRQLIRVNLELEGFDVATANDGQDCLDIVAEVSPSVVTLDVVMPRLDGWRTATQLKQRSDTSHIKIAMVTACAQQADRRRAQEIGVDAYVTKPFDPAALITTLRNLAGCPVTST